MPDINVIKVESLLDELIDADPDIAERFIQERLGRLELKKRLTAYKMNTTTLLERWDKFGFGSSVHVSNDEIRRAIAIAQALEDANVAGNEGVVEFIMHRADELLRGEK